MISLVGKLLPVLKKCGGGGSDSDCDDNDAICHFMIDP